MSKTLKVLALILAALLALSVFAGCGKKDVQGSSSVMTQSEVDTDVQSEEETSDVASTDETDKDTSSKKTEDTSSKTSSKKPTSSKDKGNKLDINKTGWPIVNKPVTFDVMGFSLPGRGDPKEMDSLKYLEAQTNVKINFIGVAENKVGERKALALQSGDLPDMFTFYYNTFTDADFNKYALGDKPIFAELSDYIKEYAPNIYATIKDNEINRALNTIGDGMYTVPGLISQEINYDHYLNINKKWLDTLGLDIPKTASELLTALRAFRDDDPNENGQADEIPVAVWNWGAGFIWNMWGLTSGDGNIGIDRNKKAYYPMTTANAKAACEYWNAIKTETGMMDTTIPGKSDSFWATFQEHIRKGNVGYFQWSYLHSWPKDLLDQYVAIPCPTAGFSNPELNLAGATNPGGGSGLQKGGKIITTKCENIPALLRYFDFFYTDEGIMVGNYGDPTKGYWTKNSKGDYQITKKGQEEGSEKQALGWAMGIPGTACLMNCKLDTTTLSSSYFYESYAKPAAKTYDKANDENWSYALPAVAKDSTTLAKLRKFESFAGGTGQMSSFVTGWVDLATWPTWVNEMNQRKLPEYVKLYQGIIDKNAKYLTRTDDPKALLK